MAVWGASHSPMGLGLDNWRAMAGSPTTLSCSNSNEGRSDAQDRRQRQAASGECWAAVKVPATKYLGACAHAAWSHSVRGGVPPTFCNESTTATQTPPVSVSRSRARRHSPSVSIAVYVAYRFAILYRGRGGFMLYQSVVAVSRSHTTSSIITLISPPGSPPPPKMLHMSYTTRARIYCAHNATARTHAHTQTN